MTVFILSCLTIKSLKMVSNSTSSDCIFNFLFQVEPLFCEWIRKNIKDWQECVVVAPDEGSVKRCTSVANDLNLDFALITNRKSKGQIISEQIYGVLHFPKMQRNYC